MIELYCILSGFDLSFQVKAALLKIFGILKFLVPKSPFFDI